MLSIIVIQTLPEIIFVLLQVTLIQCLTNLSVMVLVESCTECITLVMLERMRLVCAFYDKKIFHLVVRLMYNLL